LERLTDTKSDATAVSYSALLESGRVTRQSHEVNPLFPVNLTKLSVPQARLD
jgi:hypothetical protein